MIAERLRNRVRDGLLSMRLLEPLDPIAEQPDSAEYIQAVLRTKRAALSRYLRGMGLWAFILRPWLLPGAIRRRLDIAISRTLAVSLNNERDLSQMVRKADRP